MKRKIAVIVYHEAGKTRRKKTSYLNIEHLAHKVFEFEVSFNYQPDVFMVHDVENGICMHWDSTIMHECMAKGRITTAEAIDMMRTPEFGAAYSAIS